VPNRRSAAPSGPELVPALLLRRGEVCLPGPEGPVVVRTPERQPLDPFDVLDKLRADYDRIYLVDLDGIETGKPQLEYIQEFSREVDLWVDAGVPTADAAIDIIVAGAQRAVLSTESLRGPVELKRAWRLSTDWAFELAVGPANAFLGSSRWASTDPLEAVRVAREVGITETVLSPREADPDWRFVGAVAQGGSTWVDGTFSEGEARQLVAAGARGGVFHIERILAAPPVASSPPTESGPVAPRDDEE
jgi:hypothetical protein